MSKQETTLIQLFKKYDKDGSKFLDKAELRKVISMRFLLKSGKFY